MLLQTNLFGQKFRAKIVWTRTWQWPPLLPTSVPGRPEGSRRRWAWEMTRHFCFLNSQSQHSQHGHVYVLYELRDMLQVINCYKATHPAILHTVLPLGKTDRQSRSRIPSLRNARFAPEWRTKAAPLSLASLAIKFIRHQGKYLCFSTTFYLIYILQYIKLHF